MTYYNFSNKLYHYFIQVNLAKLCIGVGILALPSSMYEGGIVFAPLGIGVIAIWNGIACNMILQCKEYCTGIRLLLRLLLLLLLLLLFIIPH